jgi:hypothetical protein
MAEQAGRIVAFEEHDGQVVATDETGRKFTTPAGRSDWHPLDEPPPPPPLAEPAIAKASPSLAGRRRASLSRQWR